MIVVDASVLVSRLLPDEVHHVASRDWLERQIVGGVPLAAPILLLTEVGAAIGRRTGDATLAREAVNQIQRLPALRLVPIEHRLTARATDLAVRLRLRGADAFYVALAQYLSIPLVTWDREHHDRAGGIITVLNAETD